MHFHGGAMAIGSAAGLGYIRLREHLAATGLVVIVVAATGATSSWASMSNIARIASSLKAACACRSASGESTVNLLDGSRPSSPNREKIATMRGSARGSLLSVESGFAQRPCP